MVFTIRIKKMSNILLLNKSETRAFYEQKHELHLENINFVVGIVSETSLILISVKNFKFYYINLLNQEKVIQNKFLEALK